MIKVFTAVEMGTSLLVGIITASHFHKIKSDISNRDAEILLNDLTDEEVRKGV